jgi:hypothetical protein
MKINSWILRLNDFELWWLDKFNMR